MLTFWGEFTLGCLGVYMIGCYLLSLIPSPKRTSKAESVDHGLHGSNRERSESSFYGWH